jgi:hypothetical protein
VSRLLCRNTGGTWENKDVSKWAKVCAVPARYACVPQNTPAAASALSVSNGTHPFAPQTSLPPLIEGLSAGELTVNSASVSGDASCVMVRGQLRPGFDLEVEIEWILPGEPPTEADPPNAEAGAEAGAEASGADDEDTDGTDDDDLSIDDDVPAAKDDGSTRGKITIAATDLDDEDDLVLSDVKVTKGNMEPYEASKILEALRVPVHEQLQAFKAEIVASCSS